MSSSEKLEAFKHFHAQHFPTALAEIQNGKKQSHWIWGIFPQIVGLGQSATSQQYAIANLAEAQAFLESPVLSMNLQLISEALLAHKGKSAEAILGDLDAQKVHACMTLFLSAGATPYPQHIIDAFFAGKLHEQTVTLLQAENS